MQLKQLPLPMIDLEHQTSSPYSNSSTFYDPAFGNNKHLPIHRWVPWIAGFSRDFVVDVLNKHVQNSGTILDPFAGVGTTLVEAIMRGHNAVGFEINPYAALACQVKLHAYQIPVEALSDAIERFRTFYNEKIVSNYTPRSTSPKGFKTRAQFYSPKVLHKVLIFHDFVDTIRDEQIKNLFRLAFAATMVRYSNYSYEPSLGRRASAGKEDIVDFPVAQTILTKLHEMVIDITFVQEHLAGRQPGIRIINESFFQQQRYLDSGTIDLIITSPPYLNNYHYNRNTRPQLYWLDFAHQPEDLKGLEESNFGKYWQTVREQQPLDLTFTLPDTDITAQLQQLRSLNTDRGIYGGKGWANYAVTYFNDCHKFASGVYDVLKPGGKACIVIGNSILQGVMIPTDQYLGKIAESVGLELVNIHIPRETRVGNSIIQSNVRVAKAHTSHSLYEAVVELRKR